MENPGIKIPYLSIDKPIVEGTRCVEIRIPDDDAFMPVLGGLYAIATKWFNYQRDETKKGAQLAKQWNRAYLETDWEQCMNCEELTACIQPLLAAQTESILQQIRYGDDAGVKPGEHPSAEQNNTDAAAGTNPSCNKDITWSQSTQTVDWAVGLILDVLEIAETATNDVEMVQVFGELPIINEFGIPAAAAYIDMLLEGVNENFEAQVTQEYKDAYACLIMQSACNDCVITPQRLYDVAEARMRTHFVDFPTTFATIFDLWTYLSDQDIDGTIIADAMMMMLFGGGFLANAFFAAVGIKPLQIILALAVNDANDDWLILCPDCPLPEAQNVGIIGACGEGIMSTVEFEDGVPFDMVAYNDPVFPDSWIIALKLPSGNWNVTLNSITGTIVVPADETETAYAWFDTSGVFHNVLWNAPATPADFVSEDTTAGTFNLWCATQDWNVALFNGDATFTANFTVTQL